MSPNDSSPLHFRAPAKINVGLEILERRDDGFHNLQSVFLAIDLCDELSFMPTNGSIELVCEPAMTANVSDNLVYRAATLLKDRVGRPDWGAKITLRKNIPAGAGLGGGSSDAATTLLALNEVWNTRVPVDDLMLMASTLGSDVPFFINPRPSLVTGRGEEIQPLDCHPSWDVVLVTPNVHVNTAWAYQALQRTTRRPPSNLASSFLSFVNTGRPVSSALVNDFEFVVSTQHPELAVIRRKLEELEPLYVSMSGSGSAMFALFAPGTVPTSIDDIFAPNVAVVCHTL